MLSVYSLLTLHGNILENLDHSRNLIKVHIFLVFEIFLPGRCIFREKVVEVVLFYGGSSGNELVHEARVCPTAHDLPEKKHQLNQTGLIPQ
jgi:hypothetical protein